ncbi:hypothetical protein Salat_1921900 [Sesamum alatum]|uniref:Uncharacterized protein n=1 Tax=Sesamum alatum TaxID=300844 RepID=A0AAE1Y570_9LAMI|nr:hypothetical protein Salat_1921900 [Sesamum alatum]
MTVFGDIFQSLKEGEGAVSAAERVYDATPLDANLIELNRLTAAWHRALSIEEDYWRQKLSCKWVVEGERNTRYFHSLVKKKRARTVIPSVMVDGRNLTAEAERLTSRAEFFNTLLTAKNPPLRMPNIDIDIDIALPLLTPTDLVAFENNVELAALRAETEVCYVNANVYDSGDEVNDVREVSSSDCDSTYMADIESDSEIEICSDFDYFAEGDKINDDCDPIGTVEGDGINQEDEHATLDFVFLTEENDIQSDPDISTEPSESDDENRGSRFSEFD